jgi:hypothetical protein
MIGLIRRKVRGVIPFGSWPRERFYNLAGINDIGLSYLKQLRVSTGTCRSRRLLDWLILTRAVKSVAQRPACVSTTHNELPPHCA